MGHFIDTAVVGIALLAGLLFVGGAQAETISAVQADQVDALDGAGWGEPLSGNELDGLTGGQDIQIDRILEQISNAELNGLMSGNVLSSTGTGYNMLATGALNNVSGIATVIQNSGNQVIINSATILNIFTE